jgi:hypothetical protein
MVIGNLLSNYEDRKEIKGKLERARDRLLKKIGKMEEDRLKADSFEARAAEINKSLKKGIEVYKKMFEEVYAAIYPIGDISKSVVKRLERQYNGENYFIDEEADGVIQLGITAQFLLDMIDATL